MALTQGIMKKKMRKELISRLRKSFEDYVNEADGIGFWFARDIQGLLDYEEWRNFSNVIEKAKRACKKSGQRVPDHSGNRSLPASTTAENSCHRPRHQPAR